MSVTIPLTYQMQKIFISILMLHEWEAQAKKSGDNTAFKLSCLLIGCFVQFFLAGQQRKNVFHLLKTLLCWLSPALHLQLLLAMEKTESGKGKWTWEDDTVKERVLFGGVKEWINMGIVKIKGVERGSELINQTPILLNRSCKLDREKGLVECQGKSEDNKITQIYLSKLETSCLHLTKSSNWNFRLPPTANVWNLIPSLFNRGQSNK